MSPSIHDLDLTGDQKAGTLKPAAGVSGAASMHEVTLVARTEDGSSVGRKPDSIPSATPIRSTASSLGMTRPVS